MAQRISKQARSVRFKATDVNVKEKLVTAIVTAPTLDRDGDVIDTASILVPLKDGSLVRAETLTGSEQVDVPFQIDHDPSVKSTIGSAKSARYTENGELEVVFRVSSRELAQEMFTLLDEGHLNNAFSITFMYDWEDIEGGILKNVELIEISLVYRGSNRNARLIAISKSIKEKQMEKSAELTEAEAKLAAAQKEVDELKAKESEVTPVETTETPAPAPQPTETAAPAETPAPAEEPAEQEQLKEEKSKMTTEQKVIATKTPAQATQEDAPKAFDEKKVRETAIKAIQALRSGDTFTLNNLNKELGKELKKKSLEDGRQPYAEVESDFTQALISWDVTSLYQESGGLSALVNHKSLTGNMTSYRKRIRNARFVFKPAPYGAAKDVQHLKDTFKEYKVQPWAVIAAWDEEIAEDMPYNYYAEVTADLNDGALFNDEFMIMAFDGGVFGGRTYERTGILPTLKEAGGRWSKLVYDKTLPAQLTAALGNIVSTTRNAVITIGGTRTTLAKIAGITDTDGRLLFPNGAIDLGLMGKVNFVELDAAVVGDDQLVIGDYKMYTDVEKGGLKLLGSQHASIDGVSLYQTDGEALRARQRIGGGVDFIEAFYVLSTGTDIVVPAQPTVAS